ncbi:MAG: hypothetical protein ABL308_10440 [Oceanicaulis sp.]
MTGRAAETLKLSVLACAGVFALAVSGCASAPIDLRGEDPALAGALDIQTSLREEADAVVTRVDAEGWTLRPPAGEAARSFLGRLLGGAGAEEGGEDAGDPVATYIASTGDAAALQDLAELSDAVEALSASAFAVAGFDRGLNPDAIDRDIAAAERALGATRRASAFFAEVGMVAEIDGLDARLETLIDAQKNLAAAADALAERRWAARHDLTG